MRKPATFSDVLIAYNIKYEPGDLIFTNASMKIGSDRDDAIRLLIETWRLSEPQLRELFSRIMLADGMIDEMNVSVDQAVESWTDSPAVDFHSALDQKHATQLIRDGQAGAMMVILNDILSSFRRHLKIHNPAWESAGPLIAQRSVGSIIGAASNSFRHYDEWRHDWNKRKKFSPFQLKTIDVIADVLKVDRLQAAKNASFELLLAISRGHFENLARRSLQFAEAAADYK